LLALGGVVLLHILIGFLLMPVVIDLTKQPLDIRRFDPIRGNLQALLIGLVIVWTVAAFFEEMVFRGYFLTRIADLFKRKNTGLIIGVFISSLIFGFGHMYQGISGVILTGFVGIIYSIIYILNQRNLWALVLTHGLYDTSAFLIIFFNLDRTLASF
jgi:membrane protease YdiL (CAAX protease family)